MIEATVGDLLDGTLWSIERDHIGEMPSDLSGVSVIDGWQARQPKVYVVRDGDVVFYVGQSDGPVERLEAHVGRGAWGWTGTSSLGRTIEDNLPGARDWTIELWTVQECKEALADETTKLWRWDKDSAEQAMLHSRHPCLNVTHNENGQRLPDCYRGKNLAVDLSVTVSDFVPFE